MLRYLAVDDLKIEPSRQVASNSENQADANSSPVNPPVVAPPSLQQQSQSDAQAQGKEDQYRAEEEEKKRRVKDADQQQTEAQHLLDEIAIGSLVLLCGVAVAVFLRMKRQSQ